RVQEYVGGYSDWLRQREAGRPAQEERETPAARKSRTGDGVAAGLSASPATPKKLSYRERREFEELPVRIEALEAEQRTLGGTIADPEFYKRSAAAIEATLEALDRIERELKELYVRWDALDSRST